MFPRMISFTAHAERRIICARPGLLGNMIFGGPLLLILGEFGFYRIVDVTSRTSFFFFFFLEISNLLVNKKEFFTYG